jgi:hypothetical protein
MLPHVGNRQVAPLLHGDDDANPANQITVHDICQASIGTDALSW